MLKCLKSDYILATFPQIFNGNFGAQQFPPFFRTNPSESMTIPYSLSRKKPSHVFQYDKSQLVNTMKSLETVHPTACPPHWRLAGDRRPTADEDAAPSPEAFQQQKMGGSING